MARPTVSVVVPAFNEERRLPRLLQAIGGDAAAAVERAGLELLEVVVVDDGSTDRTARQLVDAAAGVPLLRPVVHDGPNRGKGHAIALGARHARGDLVLISDVDLATPLSEVGKLHAALTARDGIAVGSRAVRGSVVRGLPAHRRLMARVFNVGVRAVTGLRVSDTQCGFKLLRTALAREMLAEQVVEGFAFDIELLMRVRGAGLAISEVPVLWEHDADSTLDLSRAPFAMARDVVRIALAVRFGRGSRRA